MDTREEHRKELEFEREVLRRFINGKKMEDDEYEIIEKYSTTGITHIGFSFSKREVQARLTDSGKRLLGFE